MKHYVPLIIFVVLLITGCVIPDFNETDGPMALQVVGVIGIFASSVHLFWKLRD